MQPIVVRTPYITAVAASDGGWVTVSCHPYASPQEKAAFVHKFNDQTSMYRLMSSGGDFRDLCVESWTLMIVASGKTASFVPYLSGSYVARTDNGIAHKIRSAFGCFNVNGGIAKTSENFDTVMVLSRH